MRLRIEERRSLAQLLGGRQFPGPPPSNNNTLGDGGGGSGETTGGGGGNMKLIVVSISILLTFVVLIVTYSILRHLRLKQKSSRYVPTSYLKRKWDHWNPSAVYSSAQGYDGLGAPSPWNRRRTPGHSANISISDNIGTSNGNSSRNNNNDNNNNNSSRSSGRNGGGGGGDTNDNPAVDRNTSVRSVMTLPAYNPNPRENERVLGREGERAGIDMVVEFPETAEEEETRREEEMDALYQIRLARRAEIADRQERARLRREARERGDWATYEALRAASRQRNASGSSNAGAPGSSTTSLGSTLVTADAAHREHDRRVASVSYSDVGLARHDGTRVRANSSESDRPLLSSAASMGGRSSATQSHGRAASLLSISTNASTEDHHHHQHHHNNNSTPNVAAVIQLSTRTHQEADVGEQNIPPVDPPLYDDFTPAPPYESPVRARAPLLPAIEVTGTTPGNSRAVSPVGWEVVGGPRSR
ncbi:hypothetical protein FGG08_005121 [Glutinoglossum americanum]|uniref:Uncharacterized protein n=1 Tax=Glutinoglossum americanum TaxID=1670608 RepID=A0A9P8I475_9PEZI|nr:hypothetical protein FGG08_005121 [Glutinoglossum americanum]